MLTAKPLASIKTRPSKGNREKDGRERQRQRYSYAVLSCVRPPEPTNGESVTTQPFMPSDPTGPTLWALPLTRGYPTDPSLHDHATTTSIH